MNTKAPIVLSLLAAVSTATVAFAQTNVESPNKFAWSENCGWLNWADSGNPSGAQGAQFAVSGTFLSGFVWGENIGYINLGDGTPTNGISYSNPTTGIVIGVPDFGVNVSTIDGSLSGFAWGENIGWINFNTSSLPVLQRARMNATGRLLGYAWGENIGWINLDLTDSGKFVDFFVAPTACSMADVASDSLDTTYNPNGSVGPEDLDAFIAGFIANNTSIADVASDSLDTTYNPNGFVGAEDLDAFIAAFILGC